MKICVVSDLHMEIGHYPTGLSRELGDGGDILIIAGDLTCARYFHGNRNDADARSQQKALDNMVKHWFSKFRRVYYVMGNHEHYGYLFRETANTMRHVLKDTNVMVMDNRHEIFEDVLFIGATLWTNFNKGDRYDMQLAEQRMNDYRTIARYLPDELSPDLRKQTYNGKHWAAMITSDFIKEEYDKTINYFLETLDAHKGMKTVVITHHAPSAASQLVSRSPEYTWLYCSDLDWMMHKNHQIALWTHGHTHDDVDYQVGKTRIFANQRGYYGHEYNAKFFKPKFVEV